MYSESTTGGGAGHDENVVRSGFWKKVRQTISVVPFLDEAVAAFYCATDPKTPQIVRITLFGALAYFILPFDAVPDFLVGLGFTDDLAVLAAALRTVGSHVTDEHRERARATLEGLRRDAGETNAVA